ncbi:MAG: glutamine synthetase family protein [Pseudomonadota bacterium]
MPNLQTFLTAHPNVTHVELVLVDPSGIVRGKWAPVETLEKAFAEGVNFPLSLHGLDIWGNEVAATGLHIESGDLDGFCKAVPHTLTAVPWGGEGLAELSATATNAQVLLQMQRPDHTPFGTCARTVLENALERCTAQSLIPVCAFELEFHLFTRAQDGGIVPVGLDDMPDAQFMYGLESLAENLPVFATIRQAAQWADLPIDTIVKEAGPGQFEINLNHRADAVRAADDVILLKRIVREAARAHGLIASFMAKPQAGQPGNGMHVHISMLNEAGANIFSSEEGTTRQHHAVAGLLDTMADATLVFINTHNGFRRMAPGSYAPTRVNWGENNRSVAVRLPAAPDKAKRVEHRVSGADANPYLVLACLLTAMMDGMEKGEAPPPELVGNAYDEATPNRGVSLPVTQREALALFEHSSFITRALGADMQKALAAIKQAEIEGFAGDISAFELNSFL